MGCLDAETLFELFALGPGAAGRDSVERHLDECAACRELVAIHARACDASSDAAGDDVAVAPTVAVEGDAAPGGAAGQVVGGRYVLERVVGEGGMGVVWAARARATGGMVALEILKDVSTELTRRSLREARATSAVGHPSLIEVLDVVHAAGAPPVLVLPLLEGESLDRLPSRRKRLEVDEALLVLEPVVAGMAAAHARGVIHRDLKRPTCSSRATRRAPRRCSSSTSVSRSSRPALTEVHAVMRCAMPA